MHSSVDRPFQTVTGVMCETVEKMLKGMTLANVEEVSGALGTFYAWSKCNAQYYYDESDQEE